MEFEKPPSSHRGLARPATAVSHGDSGAAGPAAALAPGPHRMCEPCTSDALLEAVRGLRVAEPDLGFKPLLAKLREQQPGLGAATKEVRKALTALKAESEAAKAAAAASPAADEGGAPLPVALSLACIVCYRLPSDMDDEREKHPICDMCRDEKLPTTYLCGMNCPANPGAWKLHGAFHKRVRKQRKNNEDGGVTQQWCRESAERQARDAAQSGDKYDELMADGMRYGSKEDFRREAKAYREAIALKPDEPGAYLNLGAALTSSGHYVEAAQRYLEAKERYAVGSSGWAEATADAFCRLLQKECAEVAKPEWLGRGHGRCLLQAATEGVRRGGQAGVVERRGAQGAVGEGCEGGTERSGNQRHAGYCVERGARCLGGGASLGSRAQGGGHALRSGCRAACCTGDESPACRYRGPVPQPGSGHVESVHVERGGGRRWEGARVGGGKSEKVHLQLIKLRPGNI